jgi:hypothetical protein
MNIIDAITNLKGKTIENVAADTGPDQKVTGVKSFILFFTDGTQQEFYSTITFHGNDEHAAECEIQSV